MEKTELKEKLDDIYNKFSNAKDDETIMNFPRVFDSILDEFGYLIQELEDEIVEDKKKEELTTEKEEA